jgi:hypothetical protein
MFYFYKLLQDLSPQERNFYERYLFDKLVIDQVFPFSFLFY